MCKARLNGTGALVVIARVLVKERWEHRMRQEVTATSVDELCSIALAVSCGALPVSGKRVIRLLNGGSEADANHSNGIERASCDVPGLN